MVYDEVSNLQTALSSFKRPIRGQGDPLRIRKAARQKTPIELAFNVGLAFGGEIDFEEGLSFLKPD